MRVFKAILEKSWLLLILIATFLAFEIAYKTSFNVHPDEYIHQNAVCYYQKYWWPPDLNSNRVSYSPDGWSRVYNGELVYFVYGKANSIENSILVWLKPFKLPFVGSYITKYVVNLKINKGCHLTSARIFNVILLPITLVILYWVGRRHKIARYILGIMLILPQVIYTYAYTNSDAWGLSMSIFLFLYAYTEKNLLSSYRKVIALGLLTGLVILSKQSFWLSMPFSYLVVILNLLHPSENHIAIRRYLLNGGLLCATVFLLVFPFDIYYPISQGNYNLKATQTREQRSVPGFKPSQPDFPTYRLASKGVPILDVLTKFPWSQTTAMSFYGLFGYFSILLPAPFYKSALYLSLFLCLEILATIIYRRKQLDLRFWLLISGSILSVFLHIFGSIYNSWTYDVQAQGRYIFSIIPAFGTILAISDEKGRTFWSPVIRYALFIIGFALSIFILQFIVLPNPVLAISP